MRKTTGILFIFVYVLLTTEAYQLVKLPVVFQHFREHQSQDRQLSLLQFLTAHYLHGSPKDADYERDMQLPFKKGMYVHHLGFSINSPVITINLPAPNELIISRNYSNHNDRFFNSRRLNDIFQPPRLQQI